MFHQHHPLHFQQVFDPKHIHHKDYQNAFKINNPNYAQKIFDKTIKSYSLLLTGLNTKLIFPKEQKNQLLLQHPYLVFQINIPTGSQWSLQIIFSDSHNVILIKQTKRRIILGQSRKKQKKPFLIKLPNQLIKKGQWINLSVDVNSFAQVFKCQFKSIDAIYIGSVCSLRRIFTMTHQLIEQVDFRYTEDIQENVSNVPKNFLLPNSMALNQNINLNSFELTNNMQSPFKNTGISGKRTINNFNNKLRKQSSSKEKSKQKSKQKSSYSKGYSTPKNDNKVRTRDKFQKQNQSRGKSQLQSTTNNSEFIKKRNERDKSKNNKITKTQQKNRNPVRPSQHLANHNIHKQNNNYKKQNNKKQDHLLSKKNIVNHIPKMGFTSTKITKKESQGQSRSMMTWNKQPLSQSQYFQKSKKFSTINDPKFFKGVPAQDKIQQNIQMQCSGKQRGSNPSQIRTELQNNSIPLNYVQLINVQPSQNFNTQNKQTSYTEQKFKQFLMKQSSQNSQKESGETIFNRELKRYFNERGSNVFEQQMKVQELQKQKQVVFDWGMGYYYDQQKDEYYDMK